MPVISSGGHGQIRKLILLEKGKESYSGMSFNGRFELYYILQTSEILRILSLIDLKTWSNLINDNYSNLLNFVRNYIIMSYLELQNIIIRRILGIQNTDLLDQLNKILQEMEDKDIVQLSEYEKKVIQKGLDQVNEGDFKTNDNVFNRTEQWLKE